MGVRGILRFSHRERLRRCCSSAGERAAATRPLHCPVANDALAGILLRVELRLMPGEERLRHCVDARAGHGKYLSC